MMADYEFLKTSMQGEMKYYGIPGCAVVILRGGKIDGSIALGYRNAETAEPFNTATISGIGSCSKSMTAFAALRLAEKGLLDIDAPISSYVPGFALWDDLAGRMVTVRDMLCHRTGLGGHDGAWPDNGITRIEFLKRLRWLEPNVPFRTAAQYSNVMYAAVGGIMELVTGRKWETILKEELFEPLGMTRTFCLMADAASEENSAAPHRWDGGLHVIPRWNIDMAGPCGSVMSTAEDMAKWIQLHIQGGVWEGEQMLSPSRFMDMHEPQMLMDYPHIRGGRPLGYALGWRVMEYHGHIVQQHTGKIEGYSAFQFYLPGTGDGAVYLQNLHAPDNPFIFTIQGILLDEFLGRPQTDWVSLYTEKRAHAPEDMYHHLEFDCMPKKQVPDTEPSHAAEDYAGTYENPGYGTFAVTCENGNLFLDERDVRGLRMTHFHYDTFRVEGIKEDTDLYTLPLSFLTDTDTGKISGFTLRMEPKVSSIVFRRVL